MRAFIIFIFSAVSVQAITFDQVIATLEKPDPSICNWIYAKGSSWSFGLRRAVQTPAIGAPVELVEPSLPGEEPEVKLGLFIGVSENGMWKVNFGQETVLASPRQVMVQNPRAYTQTNELMGELLTTPFSFEHHERVRFRDADGFMKMGQVTKQDGGDWIIQTARGNARVARTRVFKSTGFQDASTPTLYITRRQLVHR